jgi:hypothetical protein
MATSSSDNVEYNVIIQDQQALDALQSISESAMSTDQKIQAMIETINSMATATGASLTAVAEKFQELSSFSLGAGGQGNILTDAQWGSINESIAAQNAIVEQNNSDLADHNSLLTTTQEEYGGLGASVNDFNTAEGSLNATYVAAGENMNGVVTNSKNLNETLDETEPAAAAAAGGINLVNTALRVMTAMLVFEVINAIRQFFTEAIQDANDYYQALLQISVAQSAMANVGIGGTQQDLLDIAKELSATWIDISNKDMVAAVGQTAILGTQYGLVDDQIKQIVNDEAVMVNVGQAKDMTAARNDIIAALAKTSGATSKWAADSGVSFTTVEMDAEAARLGIVKLGNAYTEAQRVAIDLGIISDTENAKAQQAIDNQKSAAEAGAVASANWTNALTTLGGMLKPITVGLQEIWGWMAEKIVPVWQIYDDVLIKTAAILAATVETIELVKRGVTNVNQLTEAWEAAYKAAQYYANQLSTTGGISQANTPTAPTPNTPGASPPITLDKTTIDQALSDYENYLSQLADDNAKFAMQQEQAQASYNNSVLQTVENYNNSVLQEQMNFNLQMAELTQEYTYNLQSALEDRNARQVLQDQAKYQMDKEKLQEEEKVRLAELKMDEQLRLEELAQNYALEQQKAEQDHQLQLQELQQAEKDKLMALAQSLDQQYKLQGMGVKDIYDLLTSYYGPGGYFDKLQDTSLQSMITKNEEYLKKLAALIAQMQALELQVPGAGIPTPPATGGGSNRYAKGGIEFANSPTTALFGEAGPELAMFMPLSGGSLPMGTNLGSLGGGAGGSANIVISLSDGLEGAIVQSTLNEIAITFEKVGRSR